MNTFSRTIRFCVILISRLLLLVLLATMLPAQSITVRATEYNISPEGTPLARFQTKVEVRPAMGQPYTLTQDCTETCVFDNLPKGSTLVFSAVKNDEPKIWVHTGDLILINKHILKLDTFDHPALLIAADADYNGAVETFDIVTLRKLILKIDSNLCRPWVLLDAAAILLPNPLESPFPETITLKNYDSSARDLEFLAIKTGNLDVEFPQPRSLAFAPDNFVTLPQPNPTRGATWFGIRLPEPATLLLEVFDTGGRQLFEKQYFAQAGIQALELPAEALVSPGLYFWRITAGGQRASGKLVRT